MPSEEQTEATLRDILHHARLARELVGLLDPSGLAGDVRTLYAVVRRLEIISEASRRLPDEMKARQAQIEWRSIAAAGNIYRHQYEDVAPAQVWATVVNELPRLVETLESEIGS
jgi:uncharacterized protein with HEPN domain